MYELFKNADAMRHIKVMQSFEEDKFTDIPGWSGDVEHHTGDAVLLYLPNRSSTARKPWVPFSQLRKTGDGLSVYATNWIIDRMGL